MDDSLNEAWTADVVGRMHRYRITNVQLANECGYTATYLSLVLNGRKVFERWENKEKTKGIILRALENIESRILKADEENTD